MVYGTQITIVNGVYKPTFTSLGGPTLHSYFLNSLLIWLGYVSISHQSNWIISYGSKYYKSDIIQTYNSNISQLLLTKYYNSDILFSNS